MLCLPGGVTLSSCLSLCLLDLLPYLRGLERASFLALIRNISADFRGLTRVYRNVAAKTPLATSFLLVLLHPLCPLLRALVKTSEVHRMIRCPSPPHSDKRHD